MSENLKRCPFCGGKGRILKFCLARFGSEEFEAFSCLNCGVMLPIYKTQEEAIKAWNKRVED